jgi:hypothetical protein
MSIKPPKIPRDEFAKVLRGLEDSKKYIEAALEQLSHIHPLDWFQDLKPAALYELTLAFSLFAVPAALIAALFVESSFLPVFSKRCLQISLIVGCISQPFAVRTLGRSLINWLVGDHRAGKFVLRYLSVLIAFFVSVLACTSKFPPLQSHIRPNGRCMSSAPFSVPHSCSRH